VFPSFDIKGRARGGIIERLSKYLSHRKYPKSEIR
jgi:hypothetical protein